uniref:Neurensin 1 n=1 Tax=Chelydra serpentina TaxID=8475 RepID=A0A8C3RPQ5_CHESE
VLQSCNVRRMSAYADICSSKKAQSGTEGSYQRYGVRSYLHQFYEDCTASIWEHEDDFQIQRSPSRWSSAFWKVQLITLRKLLFGTGPVFGAEHPHFENEALLTYIQLAIEN